jgi:hypothetical protein
MPLGQSAAPTRTLGSTHYLAAPKAALPAAEPAVLPLVAAHLRLPRLLRLCRPFRPPATPGQGLAVLANLAPPLLLALAALAALLLFRILPLVLEALLPPPVRPLPLLHPPLVVLLLHTLPAPDMRLGLPALVVQTLAAAAQTDLRQDRIPAAARIRSHYDRTLLAQEQMDFLRPQKNQTDYHQALPPPYHPAQLRLQPLSLLWPDLPSLHRYTSPSKQAVS